MIGTIPALVVLGATGTVGRAVVAAAVAAAQPVIAIARSRADLRALRDAHPGADLQTLAGTVASDWGAAAPARRVGAGGRPIGGVVAALRACELRARLLDAPARALRQALDDDLLPHLFAARHLLPLLRGPARPGGYVLVGGPAGDRAWAGYGHQAVAASALRMLARVLHDEAHAQGLRVQLLSVDAPVRTDANREQACSRWPAVEAVAREALALARGDAPAPHGALLTHPAPAPAARLDARSARDARALLQGLASNPISLDDPS